MAHKILVVSNNKTAISAIQKALGNSKHLVIVTQDSLEAVDLALDRKPSVIYLNVHLAHLSGLDVARALRAIAPTAQVPLIFLAENQAEARQVNEARLSLTECLIAPFEPAQIKARVATPAANGDRPNNAAEAENAWMLALVDPLTRVYHRRYLLHRLAYESARSARYGTALSVVLVDVDNLKEINRQHGIVTGDAVLMEVAEQLKALTRVSDVVGRCDTQDFMILAPQIDESGAHNLANRIVKAISEHHFVLEKLDLHVTVSAGIAFVAGNDLTENLALLGRAEAALERAKRAGKNRVEVG